MRGSCRRMQTPIYVLFCALLDFKWESCSRVCGCCSLVKCMLWTDEMVCCLKQKSTSFFKDISLMEANVMPGMCGGAPTGMNATFCPYWGSRTRDKLMWAACAEPASRPGRPTAYKSPRTQPPITGRKVRKRKWKKIKLTFFTRADPGLAWSTCHLRRYNINTFQANLEMWVKLFK